MEWCQNRADDATIHESSQDTLYTLPSLFLFSNVNRFSDKVEEVPLYGELTSYEKREQAVNNSSDNCTAENLLKQFIFDTCGIRTGLHVTC